MDCSDLDFECVTAKDIELIQSYLKLSDYGESNHNIVNMMIWLKNYPLFKYEEQHYLLLLGIHNGRLFIYMPLCEKKYFKEAILKAKAIFDRYQVQFLLSAYTAEAMKEVLELFPQAHACPVRSSFDYVYECEKLRSFAGKKLQKKRNHLNAFMKEYEGRFCYERIDHGNIAECLRFLDSWKTADQSGFLNFERDGIRRVFRYWDRLGCRGGLIRIDGEVKAFAIGSVLNSEMCQMNVEKADESIRGLYQVICKEFLSHEFLDFKYVNREDDLGLESLRKAKLAYHPAFMVEKYCLCKEDEASDYQCGCTGQDTYIRTVENSVCS